MFIVAFLSRVYWMIGAVIGGILGQVIPFDTTGYRLQSLSPLGRCRFCYLVEKGKCPNR